jgi:hypothetical protein
VSPLFQGLAGVGELETVWMSHGDRVTAIPDGFEVVATSTGAPFAAIADDAKKIYAVQFHPEVVHTVGAQRSISNFLALAGLKGDWTMASFRQEMVQKIRDQVGDGKVICGLSGGVDSSVAAVLIHEAIGDQLTCVFVDTGLLRKNEADQVVTLFRDHYNIPLVHVDAGDMFLGELAGVSDPETKRKTIGRLFIEVFDKEAAKIDGAAFLAQGTLYPDVIESVSARGGPSAVIKSHHNVGGLPDFMKLKLVEPLRELFKDEVRALGVELGLPRPSSAATRSPVPGWPSASRRDHAREGRRPAGRRRHLPRRDPQRRPLRPDLAGLRRAAAREDGRRHGRRPHLRERPGPARRHLDRRHDRRLLRVPLADPGQDRHADHQRSARRQPRRLRRDQQAARHHRVGMTGRLSGGFRDYRKKALSH